MEEPFYVDLLFLLFFAFTSQSVCPKLNDIILRSVISAISTWTKRRKEIGVEIKGKENRQTESNMMRFK